MTGDSIRTIGARLTEQAPQGHGFADPPCIVDEWVTTIARLRDSRGESITRRVALADLDRAVLYREATHRVAASGMASNEAGRTAEYHLLCKADEALQSLYRQRDMADATMRQADADAEAAIQLSRAIGGAVTLLVEASASYAVAPTDVPR